MKPTLEGVRLRLARADECLALLYGKRSMLLGSDRHRVIGYFDPQASEYVFRVSGPSIPADWGLIVGEFAYLLRSSLDNMLWQLILARGGTPDHRREFPIHENETDRQRKSNTDRARKQTDGVLEEDFAFIERQQPYNDRWRQQLIRDRALVKPSVFQSRLKTYAALHPLALLGHLNNVDKHRYIHPVVAGPAILIPSWSGKSLPTILSVARHMTLYFPDGGDIKVPGLWEPEIIEGVREPAEWQLTVGSNRDDPAEIGRVHGIIRMGDAWPQMKMEPSQPLEVQIGDWELPITVFDLDTIRDFVHAIVDHFAPVID